MLALGWQAYKHERRDGWTDGRREEGREVLGRGRVWQAGRTVDIAGRQTRSAGGKASKQRRQHVCRHAGRCARTACHAGRHTGKKNGKWEDKKVDWGKRSNAGSLHVFIACKAACSLQNRGTVQPFVDNFDRFFHSL